ncbi:MAG: phosphoserine phosphatase, partial [Clostridia bacterium]|nr:phosphoserine phosphatase [Clostridia bacterium]
MSAPEKKKKKGRLQFRFLIGLVVMGMVLLTAVTVLVGYLFRNSMEDYYTKTAFDAATIAAEAVDGDALKTYV